MARTKGAKNKLSGTAKENIAAVFVRLGSTAAMAKWAQENQTEFYKLYGRLIPVEQHVSGSIGNYTAVPTEQRDVDSMAGADGTAASGNPTQPH